VARIRLYVQQSLRTLPEPIFDARGQRTELPFLRVFAMIRVGRTAREVADCVIDTGAPLTVFPRVQWKKFANDIEWLSVGPGRSPSSWVTNLWGRTGGSSRCKVGRVDVEAFELERGLRSLPPVSVLAQFEEEDSADDRILTGLFGGILEGRRLVLEPDLRQAWLEER
jgi:hypothetical protein